MRSGWVDPTASVDLTFVLSGADGGWVTATISTAIGSGDEFSASVLVRPGRAAVVLYRPRAPGGETPSVEPPSEPTPEPPIDGGDGGVSSHAGLDGGLDAEPTDACDESGTKVDPPPVTCRDFCAHVHDPGLHCDPTGSADCENVCAGLHWEMTAALLVGNTLSCRDYKVINSWNDHGSCDAAFWDRSACGTPCEVYCDAVLVSCAGTVSRPSCLETCAAATDLPCRMSALIAAGLDGSVARARCALATGPTCQ